VIILNNHIVINYSYIVIKLHYYYVRLLKTCDENFHNQSTDYKISLHLQRIHFSNQKQNRLIPEIFNFKRGSDSRFFGTIVFL